MKITAEVWKPVYHRWSAVSLATHISHRNKLINQFLNGFYGSLYAAEVFMLLLSKAAAD